MKRSMLIRKISPGNIRNKAFIKINPKWKTIAITDEASLKKQLSED